MSLETIKTSWIKFGNCRDFVLIGKDAIAMASGIYVRFHVFGCRETRVERFDGGERGDGACCLAGLPVAPIFSVVERKCNPKISVFAYPTMRRISRCAGSEEEIGYLCCAFAGTEYLIGQGTYPDFCLLLWNWRTGERLTKINGTDVTKFDINCTRIMCSTDSSQLMTQFVTSTGMLSVYRVLACSKTVRLFPIEICFERIPVSCSWFVDGSLLCCDEYGTVWSIDFEEKHRIRTVVHASSFDRVPLDENPNLVCHADGVLLASTSNNRIQATFYRKWRKDGNDEWKTAWKILLPSYPRHAESDPSHDRILILGENGDLYELLDALSDNARLEFLVIQKNVKYVNIVSLQKSYLGTLDKNDRFTILDVKTGNPVCPSTLLAHHGKVADLASHPVLPITLSCSVTGNCLLIDSSTITHNPRITCVHLQREALDRVKFSQKARLFGVASFQIGRLFLLQVCVASNESKKHMRVASWLQLERKMIDFLIYEMDEDRSAKVLLLVGNEKSSDPRAGNEIIVYSCRLFDRDLCVENADRSIKLLSFFERLHHGSESRHEIIGIPYLTKQLHRIELKANFQEALLAEALPSLHQTKGIVISFHRSKSHDNPNLITCGFDGLIVRRDCDEPRRVFNLFAAHHRAEGGCRFASLVDDSTIVSLGRNGDLVANRMLARDALRGSRTTSFEATRKIERVDTIEDQEAETWIEEVIRRRSMTEERETLTTLHLSVLKDWNELKTRVRALLDENERAPPSTRLPISAFDVNKEGRELALKMAETKERQLTRDAEGRIAQLQRSTRYLRQRFLDPLIVRPRSIYSFLDRSKVTNYPLMQLTSRETEFPSPSRFSMEIGRLVSRLKKNGQTMDGTEMDEFVDVFETCNVTDRWERGLKEKFNERFEKTRSAKRREMRAITERVKETKRLVLELKNVFDVDASSSLFEAPGWHRTEILEDSFDRDEGSPERELDGENVGCEEIESKVEDFYQNALDRMMDGVLEVRLEHNARRRIPTPDCLRKDPSAYTEQDIRSIESYEKLTRARETDRAKYKLMLESEIERLREEFSKGVKSFDDELNDLAAEKVRVERSILWQKLSKMEEILRRGKIVETKREIRRVIDEELVSATEEARVLAEERDLFEAGVAELRTGYENARKRDKSLEDKFRHEFKELKPSMVEHLFRQYRKRPRALAGGPCGTSPSLLAEFVLCVIDERRNPDLLPRECSGYLRAIEELEAIPEGLARRLEPGHWRLLCRLRRLKVEAETKVNSCAIELAEAEQSLAFLRNMCSASRDKVERCKQKLERLEKSLSDLTDDREIALLLKMEQLRIRAKGCPRTDWRDAVVISREELTRVNRAISKAERERSVAQRRLANIKDLVSLEEWRHACAKMKMEELQENAKDLDSIKVSRIVRECCQRMEQGSSSKDEDARIQSVLRDQQAWHRSVAERKKVRLEKIKKEIRIWQRRNACSEITIDQSSIRRDEFITELRDPLRLNVAAFRTRKIRAIRKRARLARQIRDNFERLSILKNILEISKLRTYPTLKFKL